MSKDHQNKHRQIGVELGPNETLIKLSFQPKSDDVHTNASMTTMEYVEDMDVVMDAAGRFLTPDDHPDGPEIGDETMGQTHALITLALFRGFFEGGIADGGTGDPMGDHMTSDAILAAAKTLLVGAGIAPSSIQALVPNLELETAMFVARRFPEDQASQDIASKALVAALQAHVVRQAKAKENAATVDRAVKTHLNPEDN